MASYVVIVAQLVLLVAGLCLLVKLRHTQRSLADREQVGDLAELCGALNELLDELKETARKANEELTEKNARAHELIQEIDERLKVAREDEGLPCQPKSVLASWGEAAYQRRPNTRRFSSPDGVDFAINKAERSGSTPVTSRAAAGHCGGDRVSTVHLDRELLATVGGTLGAAMTATDIARQWRTGRGEVELMQHLARWHKE